MSDINELNEGLKWYVAHTYSGYENKVKENLQKIVEKQNLGEMITDIRIPTETIVEVVDSENGSKQREVENKIFPSYVLIKMIMCDQTWHAVRNIRGVTGFVGPGSKPVPLSDEEVAAIITDEPQIVSAKSFELGDNVEIIDGSFRGYSGKLSTILEETGMCTVAIPTVGRDMVIELEIKCIRKVQEK